MDIAAFVDIPYVGELKIGELKGNLKSSVEIKVGIEAVSGTFRMFFAGGYVCLDYDLVIFGTVEKGTIVLFGLP